MEGMGLLVIFRRRAQPGIGVNGLGPAMEGVVSFGRKAGLFMIERWPPGGGLVRAAKLVAADAMVKLDKG